MRVRKYGLQGGIEDNLPFIKEVLKRNLENGSEDIVVRKVAESIVRRVPARDKLGEITAIHNWVKNHIRYTGDPYGAELIKSPRRLLMDYAEARQLGQLPVILADCDESSLLAASLLRSIGHAARVVLVDTNPFSHEISHAIAQVNHLGKWIWLETTKDKALNWVPNHTREVIVQ